LQSIDAPDLANGRADAVRTVFRALGEDADLRPIRAFPWIPGIGLPLAIEQEHNLDVRKMLQASSAFRSELVGIQFDC
jgi:hypothetical protein